MTDFKTIDSDAVGGGTSDTQPADTWLQNRIAKNTQSIAEGHDAFTVSYANSNVALDQNLGDRVWSSLNYVSVLLADVPNWNRLKGVRVSMLLNCQSPYTVEPDLDGKFKFKLGDKDFGPIACLSSYDSGTKYDVRHHDIFLDEPISGDGLGSIPLEIWFKSLAGPTPTAAGSGAKTSGSALWSYANIFEEPGIPTPAQAGFDTRYIFSGNSVSSSPKEVIGPLIVKDPSDDDQFGILLYPAPESTAGNTLYSWYFLSYLQVRAIRIKPIFESDSAGSLPSKIYEPNRIFGSVEAQRAANAINRVDVRPRVLSIGPRGRYESTEAVTRTKPNRWETVGGDFVGSKILINDVCFLRTENPKIRITIRYISAHLGQSSEGIEGRSVWNASLFASHTDGAILVSSTDEITAPLYPAYVTSPHPMLCTLEYIYNIADDPDYAYKEGSLYEADREIIRSAVLEFDLSGHDTIASLATPVEIRLQVGLNSVEEYSSSSAATPENVKFVLVGYTIAEVPK